MFKESEAIIFRANLNFHLSNLSTTSLFRRHFQKNMYSVKKYGDSRKMNEKERGKKCLCSDLRGYPDILLERLRKTMKLLSQDVFPSGFEQGTSKMQVRTFTIIANLLDRIPESIEM